MSDLGSRVAWRGVADLAPREELLAPRLDTPDLEDADLDAAGLDAAGLGGGGLGLGFSGLKLVGKSMHSVHVAQGWGMPCSQMKSSATFTSVCISDFDIRFRYPISEFTARLVSRSILLLLSHQSEHVLFYFKHEVVELIRESHKRRNHSRAVFNREHGQEGADLVANCSLIQKHSQVLT